MDNDGDDYRHYQSGGESTVQKDYANAQEEGFAFT